MPPTSQPFYNWLCIFTLCIVFATLIEWGLP